MQMSLDSYWEDRFLFESPREHDNRPNFQRDRARILHSAAFRCLQGKTQIHAIGTNDFYRTRLTHSLEVAQIASSLVSQLHFPETSAHLKLRAENLQSLLPTKALIESLGFAHDIGHPPFGHGGEVALNYKMHKNGGFEGNGQTFRILTRLEPYTLEAGMNLTRRTLLGVIKYPCILETASPQYTELATQTQQVSPFINMDNWRPAKGLFLDDKPMFDWVLEPLSAQDRTLFTSFQCERKSAQDYLQTQHKSLDCSIMELADDIAYAVHDLEDAIVLGVVSLNDWKQALAQLQTCHCSWIRAKSQNLTEKLFSNEYHLRKDAIGALVNYFIIHIRWREKTEFSNPLLRFNAYLPEEVVEVLTILKDFVRQNVIYNVERQRIEYQGQRMLMDLFDIFASNPTHLLEKTWAEKYTRAENSQKNRIICDYIASMSDNYTQKIYQQL